MTSQTVKQRITIHIFSGISRSNFLTNHIENIVVKPVLDFLKKNRYLTYFWINSLKFHTVCFNCMSKSKATKTLKLRPQSIALTSYKAFLKNRKRSGISLS